MPRLPFVCPALYTNVKKRAPVGMFSGLHDRAVHYPSLSPQIRFYRQSSLLETRIFALTINYLYVGNAADISLFF
jgi:hypothetical protein